MLLDTVINEFRVKPIDPELVVSSVEGETAYALETIPHGRCDIPARDKEIISKLQATDSTLGFESATECDFEPYVITTYNADGSENACYQYGHNVSGEDSFQEESRFKPGDKVWCVLYEGFDVVFPGIVVGPLTEDYLRRLYDTNHDMQMGYSSADEAVEQWPDWNRDSVIVRPLVRLKNYIEEMGDTVMVSRVYVFPFKNLFVNH
ncbi:MAG: hypothetical protein K2G35_06740 [Duncaniella sp.]|nr:hypothetical protein [Duncaniella sp.]